MTLNQINSLLMGISLSLGLFALHICINLCEGWKAGKRATSITLGLNGVGMAMVLGLAGEHTAELGIVVSVVGCLTYIGIIVACLIRAREKPGEDEK